MKEVFVPLLAVMTHLSAVSPEPQRESDSAGLVVRSAVLPGLGEMKMGETRRGKFFGALELGLWITVIESNNTVNRNRSRMEAYSALHAGAALAGKDHHFAVDVANYMSLEEFNEAQQRMRRPDRVYRAEGYQWEWSSDEHRRHYWTYLRNRALAQKIGLFALGGMIVNRIASVIDVTYLDRLRQSGISLRLEPVANDVSSTGAQMSVSLSF